MTRLIAEFIPGFVIKHSVTLGLDAERYLKVLIITLFPLLSLEQTPYAEYEWMEAFAKN